MRATSVTNGGSGRGGGTHLAPQGHPASARSTHLTSSLPSNSSFQPLSRPLPVPDRDPFIQAQQTNSLCYCPSYTRALMCMDHGATGPERHSPGFHSLSLSPYFASAIASSRRTISRKRALQQRGLGRCATHTHYDQTTVSMQHPDHSQRGAHRRPKLLARSPRSPTRGGTLALSELPAQHRSLLSELSRPPSDAEGAEGRDAPVRDQEFSHLGGRLSGVRSTARQRPFITSWPCGDEARLAAQRPWRLQAYEARRRWTQAAAEAGARRARAQQCSPPWPSPAPLRRAPPRSSPLSAAHLAGSGAVPTWSP